MLIQVFKKIFLKRKPKKHQDSKQTLSIPENEMDPRSQIPWLQEHLERNPHDVAALNQLGCNFFDIGNVEAATRYFNLAFSLDDSYIPVVINQAKILADNQSTEEAVNFLKKAKSSNPLIPNIDAVYGGISLTRGDPVIAKKYALKAWLADFDNKRFANSYLFYCSYDDIDEKLMASEHKFWADTLPKNTLFPKDASPPSLPNTEKIRIGYWSPDFREHSVRYFFRPLIEGHDRELFEIILYHDSTISDEQTNLIKQYADHFFSVGELSNQSLISMMKAHQLDVLVELAGHSSANRLHLLQERLARLQLTGIGYPSTTGLSSLDGKFIDPHMQDELSSNYYTEPPFLLKNSFWCFDPKEAIRINLEPPVVRNGYVTFGCAGNIAKINSRILACWARILCQVSGSKLVLRSISFRDIKAQESIAVRLQAAGINLQQIEIKPPESSRDFFDSYNEIDIVLDTYPFNGGTTSCFATYMGVPLVTWAGRSITSRMGQSILSNLGLSELIATDAESYIEKATSLAKNSIFLKKFRANARNLYQSSALGNGKLFAKDFEGKCLEALNHTPTLWVSKVEPLPAAELVRRAYVTLRTGNQSASKRIIQHCLQHYPNSGAAHILNTQELTEKGEFEQAANYLADRLDSFSPNDQFAARLNISRNHILSNNLRDAQVILDQLKAMPHGDVYDRLQLKLLDLRTIADSTQVTCTQNHLNLSLGIGIVCDDADTFKKIQGNILKNRTTPQKPYLYFIQIPESLKCIEYEKVFKNNDFDIFIIVNKNIEITNPGFFEDVANSMHDCEILGIAGAIKWEKTDWRLSSGENKVASFISPCAEKENIFELQISGQKTTRIVHGLSVLDGSFIAIHSRFFQNIKSDFLDPLLEGGSTLVEEYLCHQCFLAGARLSAHLSLGVTINWKAELNNKYTKDARWHLTEKMGFNPFSHTDEDERFSISAPVNTQLEGLALQQLFFQ